MSQRRQSTLPNLVHVPSISILQAGTGSGPSGLPLSLGLCHSNPRGRGRAMYRTRRCAVPAGCLLLWGQLPVPSFTRPPRPRPHGLACRRWTGTAPAGRPSRQECGPKGDRLSSGWACSMEPGTCGLRMFLLPRRRAEGQNPTSRQRQRAGLGAEGHVQRAKSSRQRTETFLFGPLGVLTKSPSQLSSLQWGCTACQNTVPPDSSHELFPLL